MQSPRADLIAILAEIDQQIAQAKDTTTDPSSRPKDRVQALLDFAVLKSNSSQCGAIAAVVH